MPLELGMAMAKRFTGGAEEHDWLVLLPEGHAYGKFISDLSGFDPPKHDGSVEKVTSAVMAWLATRRDAIPPVTPKLVLCCRNSGKRRPAWTTLGVATCPGPM
jgi:hypothetical protein